MGTTPTTVGIPAQRGATRQYAILIALMLALVAGTFGTYSLTRPERATTAPPPAAEGGDGCNTSLTLAGGVVEGHTVNNTCGDAGGTGIRGGVQP